MYRTHRTLHLALALVVALTLSGCATTRVNGFVERGMDFTQYRSYTWAPADRFSTGDPRLDNNRFFSERVESAVDRRLTMRGLQKVEPDTADFVIHIHARVEQRLDTNEIDREYRLRRRGMPGDGLRRRDADARFHRRAHQCTRVAWLGRRKS